MLEIVTDAQGKQCSEDRVALSVDELAREGARRMIAEALLAEVEEFIQRHVGERDEQGRRLVVRNGQAKARNVTLGAGTVEIRAPRVGVRKEGCDRGIEPFSSKILPRYARRSPAIDDVLPVLYLRGLSTGDFQPALESLLGQKAQGLSARRRSRGSEAAGRRSTEPSGGEISASSAMPTCGSTGFIFGFGWRKIG